jgi:hypothetical protein
MTIEELYPFAIAIVAGIGYAVIWWSTQYVDPTKPTTKFQIENLLITVGYGIVIAVGMVLAGNPLSQESVFVQLGASGAAIAGAQRVLQTIWRVYQDRKVILPG